MFPSMTTEEKAFLQTLQDDKQKMLQQLQELQAVIQQMPGATGGGAGVDWHQGKGAWEEGGKGRKGRVVLDEKYCSRCDEFDGKLRV